MVEINTEFYGMKIEEKHFRTFTEMVRYFIYVKNIERDVPSIIEKVFCDNFFCDKVKIPKSILAYAFEYYITSICKNKQKWFELQIIYNEYYNEDDFKLFVAKISNFIYILKLSDEEYELHKKIFESFNKFDATYKTCTSCTHEKYIIDKEEEIEMKYIYNDYKKLLIQSQPYRLRV